MYEVSVNTFWDLSFSSKLGVIGITVSMLFFGLFILYVSVNLVTTAYYDAKLGFLRKMKTQNLGKQNNEEQEHS